MLNMVWQVMNVSELQDRVGHCQARGRLLEQASAPMKGPGRSTTVRFRACAVRKNAQTSAWPSHTNWPGRGSCSAQGTYVCSRRAGRGCVILLYS
jgi:hypothetical protein